MMGWSMFKKVREIRAKDGTLHFRRYSIIETPWFGVYIHRIYKSIKDPHLHDHPWNFVTIILKGGYVEQIKSTFYFRKVGNVVYHKATDAHNLALYYKTNTDEEMPCTSLVITGKRFREWGYLVDGKIISPQEYKDVKRNTPRS